MEVDIMWKDSYASVNVAGDIVEEQVSDTFELRNSLGIAPLGKTQGILELMTQAEINVYGLLLPMDVEATAYEFFIPKEVLELMNKLGPKVVSQCRIRYHSSMIPDPILVYHPEWNKRFLLARWGDVLLPFAELQARVLPAATRILRTSIVEAKGLISTVEENFDDHITRFLNGETSGVTMSAYKPS